MPGRLTKALDRLCVYVCTHIHAHTLILELCMVVCHAGGCWFWLTAVRAALLSVSGHFAKQAYYLQRQSLVEGPGIAPGG